MLVLGIDIFKGHPSSNTVPPTYSVVIIDENHGPVVEMLEASLNTVIRLSWEYSVNRIGIDNIYELAPTSKDIAKILSLFPSYTEIYQVTIDNNEFVSLAEQASKIGITLTSKPKPLQTAYICALLALKGVGTAVKGLERKTRIIVSRARSIGSGGSSSNRYTRGMRTAILRAVKEIKTLLEREKLDYDIVIRKSSGGLDSAIFTVYADSKTVQKIIKPYRGSDIRILIKPVYTDIVVLNNENEVKKKPLIIGIDPGIETGLAIIDLSLNVLHLESTKGLDRLDIIDKIYRYGIPAIISVDTNPPPESVKKLASMLGVQLFVPNETLDTETKEKLIEWLKKRKRIDLIINTTHKRDALAAAIRAYKAYERKFAELERKLLEMDLDVDIDEMKYMLLKSYSVSQVLEFAIGKHLSNITSQETIPTKSISEYTKATINCENNVKNLEMKIQELLKENEVLKQRFREIENKLEELLFERKFVQVRQSQHDFVKDREITRLSDQVKQLQYLLETLRSKLEELTNERNRYLNLLVSIMMRRAIVLPRIKNLTLNHLNSLKDLISINRFIVIESNYIAYDALKYLKSLKIIPLFEKCDSELEQIFIKEEIPIICDTNIDKIGENLAIVNLDDLEQSLIIAISRFKSAKRTSSNISLKDLIRIISDYRNSLIQSDG
jgi:predicted RNase H-like nuclease (RuvC/YqgF family)